MKAHLSKYSSLGDQRYEVDDRVTCTLLGAEVEVRQVNDDNGAHLVIVIRNGHDNKVLMESRAAGIWLEVHPEAR
jgi:hypothetical protein